RSRQPHRRAAPRDPRSSARPARSADPAGVRRPVSIDLGRPAQRGRQEPGRTPVSGTRARVLGWQIAVAAVLIAAWQILAAARILDPFFVSRPSDIAGRIAGWVGTGAIWGDLAITLEEAFLGLVVGAWLGIALGFVLARAPLVARVCDPFITMLNAVPRVV